MFFPLSIVITKFRFLQLQITIKQCEEELDDTKLVIRIRKSKKDRQHNGQKNNGQKDKQRSTKHTHKTKDRVTRTPIKMHCYRCTLEFFAGFVTL
jgi:hypothetical protein